MRFTLLAGLFLAGILFISRPALAQSDTTRAGQTLVCTAEGIPMSERLWYVKFSPQHLFISGYNLEVERLLAPANNHSFTFSPRYYSGKTKTIDKLSTRESESENSAVKGYGVEILHRFYRKNPLVKEGRQYFAYGLNYHHFDLDYEALGWAEVEASDGLKYFLYQWHQGEEKVDRFGAVAMMGVQNSFITERLITDFYGGLGYRFSTTSRAGSTRFGANILDYGSSGVYLTVGFKLGYAF